MKIRILTLVGFLFIATSSLDAQWVPTAGPYGGTVTAMAALGTNVYAGTTSGIFRSTDSGASWANVTSGLGSVTITNFAMLDSDIFAAAQTTILRSTDQGRSWRSIGTGLNNSYLDVLAVLGNDLLVTTLYYGLGNSAAAYRSTDDGRSWSPVLGIPPDTAVFAFAAVGTTYFAGTQGGVYRSTDSGLSWTQTAGVGLTSPYMAALAALGDTLFGSSSGTAYFSTDSGDSWSMVPGTMGNGFNSVRIFQALGSRLYAGTYAGLFWSTDDGVSWQQPLSGLLSVPVSSIAQLGNLLFAGTQTAGIFTSSDGGANWSPANNGLAIASVVYATALGPRLFVDCYQGDVYASDDSGAEWNDVSSGMASSGSTTTITALASDPVNGAVFAATDYNGVQVSFDSGVTWQATSSSSYGSYIYTLKMSGNYLYAGTDAGIFRSPDDGITWIDASTGLLATNLTVEAFAQSGNTLYCATQNDGVFYSIDSGATWNDISPSGSSYDYSVSLATAGNYLFLGTQSNGLVISSNNGSSWHAGGLSGLSINALLAVGQDVFAATSSQLTGESGLYLSVNHGATWTEVSTGLPAGISINVLQPQGGNIYAGTGGYGVWRRPITEMIPNFGVSGDPLADRQSTLENYPNPFRSETRIPLLLRRAGHVTAEIFDVTGQKIATLANSEFGAGMHEIVWNAADAAPGVYQCRVSTPDGEETLSLVREK